uniref:Putative the pwwp domain part of the hepatoma derived growth factor n=1 Tax=Corethrella appendiculata TaxID=1370023 RepID=U5ET94_9DIPT
MVNKKTFNIGDLVFARVKGYPPWPAKITKQSASKKYNVYFYGTGETANIKIEDLYIYKENKAKFANEKNMRKPFFSEAVTQIEAALDGDDPSPIGIVGAEVTTNDKVVDESKTEEKETNNTVNETFDESRISANSTTVETSKLEESESVVVENNKQEPQANVSVKEEHPVEDEPAKETEIVSRSGRKIKPKRFTDSITEEDEHLQPPAKKRGAIQLTTTTDDSGKENNKTVKKSPTKKIIKKEETDENEVNRVHLLTLESKLIELNQLIKASVGLSSANVEKCVELLDDYKKLKITQLMLKKHPNCVETMKRLRRYVGNAKAWNLADDEKKKFEEKAEQVRNKADEIYNGFKKLFGLPIPDGKTFWDVFSREVLKEFSEKTKHLTKDEIVTIVDEAAIPPAPSDVEKPIETNSVNESVKTEDTKAEAET